MSRKQKLIKFLVNCLIVVLLALLVVAYFDTVFLALIVLSIATLVIYFRQKPFKLNTVVCITGAPGSGKTKTGTSLAIRNYRRQRFLYVLNKLTLGLLALYVPKAKYAPHLYSNIPICIGEKNKRPVFCEVLKMEHILMTERLPEYSTVFIDEIGSFCGQWEYENPYVQCNVQVFVRFFRHFIGTERAGLIMTEQSSDFIAKVIRDRVGMIINMTECRRAWKILPILRLKYVELLSVEGTSSTLTVNSSKLPYIAVFTPYRWMPQKRKVYESRCYKYLYQNKAIRSAASFDDYYTRYLIDLSVNERDKVLYKRNRKQYMDEFLFDDSSKV